MDIEPTVYHKNIVAYLQQNEPELWTLFASAKIREKLNEDTKLELLKSTVRLDKETYERIYRLGEEVLKNLHLNVPVLFYQSANTGNIVNASVFFVPFEAHIVLQGPVMDSLDDNELQAMIGHELSHLKLWQENDGIFFIADRLLDANLNYNLAENSHLLTANRYKLYSEIYSDRGSYIACGNLDAVIRCIMKVQTGLTKINTQAYLEQAEEICASGKAYSEGITHPESYIRARALSKWVNKEADSEALLVNMIEGETGLDMLDILGQAYVTRLTKDLLSWLFNPEWMHAESLLAHARLFDMEAFDRFFNNQETLIKEIKEKGKGLDDYWCYILIDFAALDTDMNDLPLLQGLTIADQLNLRARMEELVCKELKYNKKTLSKLWNNREELFPKQKKNNYEQ